MKDGVTITVSVRDAESLTLAALDWAVPGHLEDKVLHLLKDCQSASGER